VLVSFFCQCPRVLAFCSLFRDTAETTSIAAHHLQLEHSIVYTVGHKKRATLLLRIFANCWPIFTWESSYCFSASWLSQFCLSVHLSVCLSHRWISQKRCKLPSPNLHRRLPGRL